MLKNRFKMAVITSVLFMAPWANSAMLTFNFTAATAGTGAASFSFDDSFLIVDPDSIGFDDFYKIEVQDLATFSATIGSVSFGLGDLDFVYPELAVYFDLTGSNLIFEGLGDYLGHYQAGGGNPEGDVFLFNNEIGFDFTEGGSENVSGSWNAASYTASAVPIPSAVWLFGSALIGLIGSVKRKKHE